MMRFFKVVIVSFLMILASSVEANAQSSKFNWGPVMDAIIQLESKGNALAVNGSYVGVLQISPVLVKECNNIVTHYLIDLTQRSLRRCLLSSNPFTIRLIALRRVSAYGVEVSSMTSKRPRSTSQEY